MNTTETQSDVSRTDLLEMDIAGKPEGKPVPPTVTEAPADNGLTVTALPEVEVKQIPGITVDQAAVRRCMADEAAAVKAGFSLKPPVYQMGTLVNELGQANFRKSRKEFDALPMIGDACQKLVETVRQEDRKDIKVDIPNLLMYNDGTLQVQGNGVYKTSERAVSGLAFFSVPGGGGGNYFNQCPSHLRARNLNHWFEQGYRIDTRLTKKQAPDGTSFEEAEKYYTPKTVTVRTRKDGKGDREAYAVVGGRYGNFDVDKVAAKVYESLAHLGLSGARADFTYDGYKARLDILTHTNVKPEKAAAGEIFKAGIVIRTADDGSGSINVSTEIWRNLCLNLIIIDWDKVLVGRRRHSGKTQDIADKLTEHLATAEAKMKHFCDAWSAGTVENILEKYDLGNPRLVFEGLIRNKIVPVGSGSDADEMVNRLMEAWSKEEGYSKTAFVNAITRCAHESEWKSWETVDELESVAGELLFQKVWNCIPPKDKTADELLTEWK